MKHKNRPHTTAECSTFSSLSTCFCGKQVHSPYLDPNSLVFQVNRSVDWTGPRVEVEEDSSRQGKQGDDGRGGKRGEEHLEEEVHGTNAAAHTD